VAMLLSQQADALLAGRLIVGLGVGLAMTSGTAWASDLKGPPGAAAAGALLTGGFAIGPFAAGVIAWAGQPGIRVSFGVAAAIVVAATSAVVVTARRADLTAPPTAHDSQPSTPAGQGTPAGVWVGLAVATRG